MKFYLFYFWVVFLVNQHCFAIQLEFVNSVEMPHKMKFQNSKIGGISGIYFTDNENNKLFVVSDDRGKINEPRIYEFDLKIVKGIFSIQPVNTFFLKKQKIAVLDMESITQLPWGNLLVGTEGDMNYKPRVPPQMMEIKKDGTYVRDFLIPDEFLPEVSGKQTKGVKNNRGFEGLTKTPSGNKFYLATEQALFQDLDLRKTRILQFEMKEAWVLSKTKDYIYILEPNEPSDKNQELGMLENGVSEILAIDESELLVLERAVLITKNGLKFKVRLFSYDLNTTKKKQVLDLDDIKEKISDKIENFEALSFGPMLDGKKTLIIASDDNFKKKERSLFLFFKMKE